MGNGYTTRLKSNGLLVVQPKRARRGISGKSILLFLVAFFAFKGFLIANLGLLAYEDRLTTLQGGTVFEQAGAWVMQADPAAQFIAEKIGPVLR
jgi:hypothetical protein